LEEDEDDYKNLDEYFDLWPDLIDMTEETFLEAELEGYR